MKKQLCTLSAMLLALLLAACGADSGNETTTQNAATTPETEAETEFRYTPNVPDSDFGGEEFKVLSISYNTYPITLGFDFEEDSADIVQSSIYKRNRAIEEDYNINFSCTYVNEWGDPIPVLKEQAMAGDDEYQLIMMICREAFKAAIEGYVLPYDGVPHIDTTQPWYMKNVNDMMSIGGTTVLAYTDECMNAYLQNCCVFFNKQLIANLDLDDPYQMVRDGKWTHDAFYELATAAISDINGDGKYDVGDRFGVNSEADFFFPSMWVGSNINTIEKDNSDIPIYTVPGNEALTDIIDVTVDHLKVDGFYIDSNNAFPGGAGDAARDQGCQYFAEGNTMFRVGIVGNVLVLRNMEADFGILPLPKYSEAEENYYGRMIDGWLHVPPVSVQNTERLGVIMEALGAESKNYVIPTFFDIALTDKLTRDTDSEEMLNIIFDNISVDLGDTVWFDSVRSKMTPRIASKKTDTVSYMTKIEKAVNKTINTAIETFAQ